MYVYRYTYSCHEKTCLDSFLGTNLPPPNSQALAGPQRLFGPGLQTLHSQKLSRLRPRRQAPSLDPLLPGQRPAPLHVCATTLSEDPSPSAAQRQKTRRITLQNGARTDKISPPATRCPQEIIKTSPQKLVALGETPALPGAAGRITVPSRFAPERRPRMPELTSG